MSVATTTQTEATEDVRKHSFLQLIDGQLLPGAGSQPVIDPGTEQVIATSPVADSVQVDKAVAAARQAFPAWAQTSFVQRRKVVEDLLVRIRERHEQIATIITLETGKPIDAARGDVDLAITWAEHTAALAFEPEVLRDDSEARVELRRRPLGVVVAIVPWNFPFFQTMYKLVPALMTGNTVVIKTAPSTPMNGLLLGELIADLVAPGVVNVIGDDGSVGPHLTKHPDVDKVSFTGSTRAGREVMASAAPTLKRLVLELGGNDAALVLDDADVDDTVEQVFSWAFMNSGQVCINIKRIFVHTTMYDEFAEKFAARARSAVVGHGLEPGTELGPLQNARQYEAAKSYLSMAHEHGNVIAGGQVMEGAGYFVEPTVVRDIRDDSPLVGEETFGPVRSLLMYDDVEDAIRRVNDTPYGLGNSVWAADVSRATEVAARLESGTVWINTHFALQPDVPFGGHKQSGIGVEFGAEGMSEFTNSYVIYTNRS